MRGSAPSIGTSCHLVALSLLLVSPFLAVPRRLTAEAEVERLQSQRQRQAERAERERETETARYMQSVYLHYLHVVDADPAPVTWALGAKCAHSTLCVVKGDEQETMKIPCGTKTIGQMDRTKEKEKMQKKEAEAPFQGARQPPRASKARLIKKSSCGFWVSPFRILQVLVLFWSVPYADGFQLEMVGALSASLDHHCPSGFLCRASFHGLAQPWLGKCFCRNRW